MEPWRHQNRAIFTKLNCEPVHVKFSDYCRGTPRTPVFGGARSAQSHQHQPQRHIRRKHPDQSCPSKRPLSPRTFFLAPSLWHSFQRTPVAWQPTTVWGLQGNWERRAEDREDGMPCLLSEIEMLRLQFSLFSSVFLLFSHFYSLFFPP